MGLYGVSLGVPSKESNHLNHSELVNRAGKWLQNKCVVVAKEMKATDQVESPDCIGFQKNYETILVECKSNHLDYIQDLKKPHRQSEAFGMGYRRYYFCQPNIISVSEIPDKWGLVYVHPHRCDVVRESGFFQHDKIREFNFLLTVVRRLGQYAPSDLLIDAYHGNSVDVMKG